MLADLLRRILRAVLTEASLDDGAGQRCAVTSHEPVMLFDDVLQAHFQREGEQRQRRSFVLDGEVGRVKKSRTSVPRVESKSAPCPAELGVIVVPDSLRAALFLSARLQCARNESSLTSKPIAKAFSIYFTRTFPLHTATSVVQFRQKREGEQLSCAHYALSNVP